MTYASPLSQPCRTGQHGSCHWEQCQCPHHAGDLPAAPVSLGRQELQARLMAVLDQLGRLEALLVHLAGTQGIDPMQMQYPSGEPAMAPLVTAEAQALAGLAQLQAAETSPRALSRDEPPRTLGGQTL